MTYATKNTRSPTHRRFRRRRRRPLIGYPKDPEKPKRMQAISLFTDINFILPKGIKMKKITSTSHKLSQVARLAIALPFLASMTLPAFADIENTAQVSGSTPDGGTVTDSSTEVITLQAGAPSFTIVKTIKALSVSSGADSANPDGGDTITYQYVVDNTGNVSIDGASISITDPGPTFATNSPENTLGAFTLVSGDTNTDDELGPNETWTYEATYTLAQLDVDRAAGVTDGVSNTITAASATAVGSFGAATFQSGASTLTALGTIAENGALSLTKLATRDGTTEDDGSGPGTAYNAGETVIYRLSVENTGNVTMSSMTVSDTAFDGAGSISAVSCSTSGNATIATLAPGASEVCTATYVIQEADL